MREQALICKDLPSLGTVEYRYRKFKRHFQHRPFRRATPENALGASQRRPPAAPRHSERWRRPQHLAAARRSGPQQGAESSLRPCPPLAYATVPAAGPRRPDRGLGTERRRGGAQAEAQTAATWCFPMGAVGDGQFPTMHGQGEPFFSLPQLTSLFAMPPGGVWPWT